ncbi:CHAT domain-containing protein [Emticicia sp. TH156]|uniref:CHAT domain-containing protein n=1 Tax=Emticicia sp. TH156 TaxID=2067454 RepID=UPI000C758CC5|nr:CHAT domain-containing tetratricopeptide repeat protein [Emticicia sp. TH156]PLK42429.1 hypothetical protein C0V77_20660 [Emticicia sp. TH156]
MKILFIILTSFLTINCYSQNRSDKLRSIAEDCFDNGDIEKAYFFYIKAFKIAKKSNDYVRMTNLYIDISSLHHYKAEYKLALEACREGLAYHAKITPSVDTISFKLYSNYGTMLKALNMRDSARLYFESANNLLLKNKTIEGKIPSYAIHFYNNYGRFLNDYRDFSNGILLIEKALLIAQKYKLKEDEVIILTNLSNIYESLGENEKALRYIQKADQEQTEKNQLKCFTLSCLGWCLILNNKFNEGVAILKKALKLANKLELTHKPVDNFRLKTNILYNLGIAYLTLGQKKQQAERYFQDAIRIFKKKKINKDIRLAKCYLRLSEINKNNLDLSIENIQKSLKAIFNHFESKDIFENPVELSNLNETVSIEVLTKKSLFLFNSYKKNNDKSYLNLALKTINLCLDIISNTRNNYDYSESKLVFNKTIHSSYQLAVTIALAKYQLSHSLSDKEYILSLIEKSKATELNEALYLSSIKNNLIPVNYLKKEDSLNELILRKKLLKNKDRGIEESLNSLKIEKINLLRQIEKLFPEYYNLKFKTSEVKLAEIQKKLNDNAVFLSYFSTEEELLICIVTKENFEIKTIKLTPQFISNLNSFKDELYQNPGFGNYEGIELSANLYETLITPLKPLIKNKDKLIISKDWLINFLPFEVLESGKTIKDYLIKKYSVEYTYSARQIIEEPKKANYTKTLGLAPFNENKPTNGNLKYLPESEKQVVEIADETLLGEKATKNNFLKHYQSFSILYLATHSFMNDKFPSSSFICFYPKGDSSLTVDEIYTLKLTNTRLVVLSSCDAGIGQEHHSEGMLSIARAFSLAGCSSIISTLWATNDESASLLTRRLHYYLKKGVSKDVALQKAKIDFIEKDFAKKYNHPYFWSNLILIGNDQPVFQESYHYLLLTLGFLILFTSGLIYFFKKKKM